MRLVCVIASLGLGGAQRALASLTAGLAGRGHSVEILCFDAPGMAPFFPLDPRVGLRRLDLLAPARNPLHGLLQNLRRVRVLRRALREAAPDAVLSFMDSTNVLCLLAGRGLGAPVLACERTDPRRHPIGPLWSALRRLTYQLAARVVAQTATAAAALPGRVVVIPNGVIPNGASPNGVAPKGGAPGGLILGIGRLAPEKGFDLLLTAFAKAAKGREGWRLVILGEGPERTRLTAQRAALGLDGRAELAGAVADVSPWLGAADVFALPSRYEGFPNALLEALAAGVPALAFACGGVCGGILRDGVDGLLAADGETDAFAAALARLMDDGALRRAMAARAPEVRERFGMQAVLDRWEALLVEVAGGGK